MSGRFQKHDLTTLSLRFSSQLPFLKKGFTAALKVSQHSRAHACMIRLQLPWFCIPFFSVRCGARSFGLVIKELWHLLMREEGFSKRVLVEEKSKYTLRGANAGSLPWLWCIHIIDALLHTHRSSELLHNTSASTVSLFLSSEIILGLQNHKQDGILHIGGDCRRHHSPLTHVFDCRFLLLVHCSDTGKCNGSGSGCPAVHHQAGPLTGMWHVGPVV